MKSNFFQHKMKFCEICIYKRMRAKAFLVGINYVDSSPRTRLNGCANDVHNMKQFLMTKLGFHERDIEVATDEDPKTKGNTTAVGILHNISRLAWKSWNENLDVVWIHYSGHGTSVRDQNGGEKDGRDEAIVPSDYNTRGVVLDDYIHKLFDKFNPKTKVICIFDCCHSGSIADLKYRLCGNSFTNEHDKKPLPSKVLMLSGCSDSQTSADAWNVMNMKKFSGALSSCFISGFKRSWLSNVQEMLNDVRGLLKRKGFTQTPQLCSSYNTTKDKRLML